MAQSQTTEPKVLPATPALSAKQASARKEHKPHPNGDAGMLTGTPVDAEKRRAFVPMVNKRMAKLETAVKSLAGLAASRYDHTVEDAAKVKARFDRAAARIYAMLGGAVAQSGDEDLT